jgi:hypothetical protein
MFRRIIPTFHVALDERELPEVARSGMISLGGSLTEF